MADLSDKAANYFSYFQELPVELEVDRETGTVLRITKVNGTQTDIRL